MRDTLRGAEREAKQRYLAPVRERAEPYLKMILPGSGLKFDENLDIDAIERRGAVESFTSLSAGTQEQLAVLTRLAFAELLLDQGRPATVILDDAVVFSDDERIELIDGEMIVPRASLPISRLAGIQPQARARTGGADLLRST